MTVLDLYDPKFPHGTDAGWEKGCKSNTPCEFFGSEEWLTCTEAHLARQGDYQLRQHPRFEKIPRNGPTPAPPARPAAQVFPPLGVRGLKPTSGVNAAIVPAKDDHDAPTSAPVVPAPEVSTVQAGKLRRRTQRPAVGDPDFPHGTTTGYAYGCRLKDGCPGVDEDGQHRSCNMAVNEQGATARRNRLAAAPAQEELEREPVRQRDSWTLGAVDDAEPRHDPTHGSIDFDIQDAVDDMHPKSVGQRVALEETAQDRRDAGTTLDTAAAQTPDSAVTIAQLLEERTSLRREVRALEGKLDQATLDLNNSERAARDLAAAKQVLVDELATARTREADLRSATDREATRIYELEEQLEQLRRAIAEPTEITPRPLEAPGGDTGALESIGLTITPTAGHGVQLGFTAGQALDVRIAVAATDQPGLGDIAIRVGS